MPVQTTRKNPHEYKEDLDRLQIGRVEKAILQIISERFIVRGPELRNSIPRGDRKRKSLKTDRKTPREKDHDRAINTAINKLRKEHLIRTVEWTDPTRSYKSFYYRCDVHGLTERGFRLVRSRGLDEKETAKSFETFSVNHVDHELKINDFLDILEAALGREGLELIVYNTDLFTVFNEHVVSPDRLLYIYDPKTDTTSAPIFLEYEKQKRGKYDEAGRPQVIRKLINLNSYYDTDDCEKDFKFRKFYVLVILRTERKRQFLAEDLISEHQNTGTLLLASEQEATTNILGDILHTWNDGKPKARSLLDL